MPGKDGDQRGVDQPDGKQSAPRCVDRLTTREEPRPLDEVGSALELCDEPRDRLNAILIVPVHRDDTLVPLSERVRETHPQLRSQSPGIPFSEQGPNAEVSKPLEI